VAQSQSKRTIGGKLNKLVLLSVGLALLVGGLLSAWGNAQSFVVAKREVLQATAQVFSAAVSHAVASEDAPAVMQALRAVARIPGLMHVEVFGQDGKPLAEVGSGARLTRDLSFDGTDTSPVALLKTRTITLRSPVIEGGRSVGEIVLVSDTVGLAAQFWSSLSYAVLGSVAGLIVGLACAFRLQRSITDPLKSLIGAMALVEVTRNYAAPVDVKSDDETSLLATHYNSMISNIRDATNRILDREKEIIERLGRAGEMRDDQTGEHVIRVAKISRIIANELRLSPSFIDDLCRASPMHDVGKIGIRDAILHKPGPLSPEERCEMELHARAGADILAGSSSELVQLAAEIALTHHEKWDGTGYPNKLAGEAIPLSGRITAVADVCDALLSERPYKRPWSLDRVRELMLRDAGTHFDPGCVTALMSRWSDLQAIYASTTPVRLIAASA
jgi:putative two-component system response regulator